MKEEQINKIINELQKGMSLEKCKKCGCMKDTLENILSSLPLHVTKESLDLFEKIKEWLEKMEPIEYSCLGCKYCYPASAMNTFTEIFPEVSSRLSGCSFEIKENIWPSVPGEYFAFCEGKSCPVAVSTLASVELAERLAKIRPPELCIVGKTETENIGIDKIIKNTITNPTIRVLLLAGKDPEGHYSGKTLLALWENGVDERMRVIDAPGKHPVLRNVSKEEIEIFRNQIKIVDMIGCEDEVVIIKKIKELSRKITSSCRCDSQEIEFKPTQVMTVPVIKAQKPDRVEMDRAGYFVIIPQREKKIIIVEHYSYENKLLRIIEGKDAKSIYHTVIKNGWVTQLSHAAYLGKELIKAELSIKFGFKYIQDGID